VATVRHSRLADIDAVTLYKILKLRTDVFVVEQACPYPELDGRDLEPSARQFWVEHDGEVLATLRLLLDTDGTARIGRVATARAARGDGLGAQLMRAALELAPRVDIALEAQSYLLDWYSQFGFVRDGDDYLEDGIAHVPMRRVLIVATDRATPAGDLESKG
jgi:ElaA protein